MKNLPVEQITMRGRVRKSYGDIDGLAESINRLGLLQPIGVRDDNTLVCGGRRLKAVKKLGWSEVPVHVCDNLTDEVAYLEAERDENTCRLELTPDEALKIFEKLEPKYQRLNQGVKRGPAEKGGGSSTSKRDNSKRTSERAAIATGYSEKTLRKVREVKAAAKEDPDSFGELAKSLGEPKCKVDAIHRKYKAVIREQEKAKAVASAPSPPRVYQADMMDWLPKQEPADLILTDPPYMTDVDNVGEFARQWLPLAMGKLKPTGRMYVFIGAYPKELAAYLSVAEPAQVLVWTYRNTLGPSPKHQYKLNWQAILYYQGSEAPPLNCPEMTEQFSVQDIAAPDGRQYNRYHEWQKPDEIGERFVRHSTSVGDIVLDPFCCTGTFVLAAHRLGRVGIGCDLSEDNLSIAKERGCAVEA